MLLFNIIIPMESSLPWLSYSAHHLSTRTPFAKQQWHIFIMLFCILIPLYGVCAVGGSVSPRHSSILYAYVKHVDIQVYTEASAYLYRS